MSWRSRFDPNGTWVKSWTAASPRCHRPSRGSSAHHEGDLRQPGQPHRRQAPPGPNHCRDRNVSPGNKDSRAALRDFVEKTVDCLRKGIHVLIVDLFPPTQVTRTESIR